MHALIDIKNNTHNNLICQAVMFKKESWDNIEYSIYLRQRTIFSENVPSQKVKELNGKLRNFKDFRIRSKNKPPSLTGDRRVTTKIHK